MKRSTFFTPDKLPNVWLSSTNERHGEMSFVSAEENVDGEWKLGKRTGSNVTAERGCEWKFPSKYDSKTIFISLSCMHSSVKLLAAQCIQLTFCFYLSFAFAPARFFLRRIKFNCFFAVSIGEFIDITESSASTSEHTSWQRHFTVIYSRWLNGMSSSMYEQTKELQA